MKDTARPRLLLVVNVSWFFLSHRLVLATAARERGFDVHLATCVVSERDRLRIVAAGLHLHEMPFARGPWHPLTDLRSFRRLLAIYLTVRPDIVHLVTLKAIVIGGIAARIRALRNIVAAIPGLGHAFTSATLPARIRRAVMRVALRLGLGSDSWVIVQNAADRRYVIGSGLVREARCALIRGSGVDLAEYAPTPEPPGPVRVLLAARMLRAKGVETFVEAARLLRASHTRAHMLLAGAPDPENPGTIEARELERWSAEGVVEWLGHREDMAALLASVHIVCLPTYYGEGVPKILIEAAARRRAIVATDNPGCGEVVTHDVSGLLVPARDPRALAAALSRVIESPALRDRLAAEAHRHVATGLALPFVLEQTFRVYDDLLQERRPGPVHAQMS